VRVMDEAAAQLVPGSLWTFVSGVCRLPAAALSMLPPDRLPAAANRLLVHRRDMTSTLAEFHGSDLRVDILQEAEAEDYYLREVFLRAIATGAIVEYGVIAIAMARFSSEQQTEIRTGGTPLGGLLHRFHMPFESAPVGFFSIPADKRAGTRLAAFDHGACHGRFNHLATPAGEPIAWIMEILPGTPRE